MVKRGLSAAIYTQTTDVEGGKRTYHLRQESDKDTEALLRSLHQPVYEQPDGIILFVNQEAKQTGRLFFLPAGASQIG